MQDVIRISPPDPGDRALVSKDGVHASRIVRSRDPLGELVGERLGPEAAERAVVARPEHPPAGLPLAPELPDEHGRPDLASDSKDGPSRLRGLRGILHVDATT